MTAKGQGAFGFRIAYDTRTNTLYYAEAITRVLWMKKAIVLQYTSTLFQQLFRLK